MVAERAVRASGSIKRGVSWILLVVVVPVVFACVLLGGALQVLGFPVVRDAMQYVGLEKPQTGTTPLQMWEARYQHEQRQLANLQAANRAVHATVNADTVQMAELKSEIRSLQKSLAAKQSAIAGAKAQAQLLTAMEPQQAALVVAKMSLSEAAQVIAAMSATDAGPVLAQMDPTQAAKIMAVSAK